MRTCATRAGSISGARRRASGGAAAPAFDPATLFGVSDRGGIYDMTSSANLFQLSGGTGAVVTGDPIGYVADLGPISRPALQATTTARPIFNGWPRSFGSTVVTNGRFTSDVDWTKGTGWTIAGGRAAKTAGTAAMLSQAITLMPGKGYFFQYQTTRTAGTVVARFTGGTTVAGFSRNINGGWFDVLFAATGNTTIEFSADAAFAGEVFNVVVREVTAWVNEGAYFDGVDDRVRTAAIDLSTSNKATLILATRYSQVPASRIPSQFGGTGQVRLFTSESASGLRAQFVDGTNTATSTSAGEISNNSFDALTTVIVDADAVTVADQIRMRSRGYDITETSSGTLVTAGPMAANGVFTLGSPFNSSSWMQGHIRRALLINRVLSGPELVAAEAWVKKDACFAGVIGDSTVSINVSANPLPNAYSIASLVGGLISGGADVSKVGDRIADQMTLWSAVSGKSALECVFMQIGLNDIKGRIGASSATSADIIAELQAAVTTVRASVSASCKIYICGLNPCKFWLDDAAAPAAAYAGWLAVNEAIAGAGATPIAGVDGRVTSHVAALNDGAGNLQGIYQTDSADGVHENSEGRFIIAQAWRTQLEADGLL